ncbi:MAG: hypothetical protein LBU23_07900 [Planctomycetota bacterium]|nr:hypothetical protein [Planctomycetota bacterium]
MLFYLPRVVYSAFAAWALFRLWTEKTQHDPRARIDALSRDAARAARDRKFRADELAGAEAELAALSGDGSEPFPISVVIEALIAKTPAASLYAGAIGVFTLYFGIFHQPAGDSANWPLMVGLFLLGLVLLFFWFYRRFEGRLARVRALIRKYLMLKAGNELEPLLQTLAAIREYYPDRPELLLESADRLAAAARLEEAVGAVRQAREMRPDNLDFALLETSYLIRDGRLAEAGEALARVEANFARAPTDPRLDIYLAALAAAENRIGAAWERLEKALQLDSAFSKGFIGLDQTLMGLEKILAEHGVRLK